jgi:hypothetical protein
MTKASKTKWKSFKKTLNVFEEKVSMEHQNPTLWAVIKRRGTNLGSKSFGGKFYSNVYQDGLSFESN